MSRDDDLGTEGFKNGPLYDAARPDYPGEAIEYFVSVLGLTRGTHVLDLGAGTGIFTRQLLAFVDKVTAVEPSESMRASLASTTPGVDVLEGSDVAIPLANESVDAVFAAQAFHWFDAPRALLEIRRVLTPSGGLGLVWNERDESVEWVAQLSRASQWDVRAPYDVGADFTAVIAAGPFTNVERVTFPHSQTLSREGLRQRVLTTSYITVMDEPERAVLMAEVSKVVDQLAEPIELPYVTTAYSASVE